MAAERRGVAGARKCFPQPEQGCRLPVPSRLPRPLSAWQAPTLFHHHTFLSRRIRFMQEPSQCAYAMRSCSPDLFVSLQQWKLPAAAHGIALRFGTETLQLRQPASANSQQTQRGRIQKRPNWGLNCSCFASNQAPTAAIHDPADAALPLQPPLCPSSHPVIPRQSSHSLTDCSRVAKCTSRSTDRDTEDMRLGNISMSRSHLSRVMATHM